MIRIGGGTGDGRASDGESGLAEALVGKLGYLGIALILILGGLGVPVPEEAPIILAAGVYKIPELFGPLGAGIHGQVLVGSIASFVCAYLAVRYLTQYFQTRTLTPFAIYCALVGGASLVWLTLR